MAKISENTKEFFGYGLGAGIGITVTGLTTFALADLVVKGYTKIKAKMMLKKLSKNNKQTKKESE